MNSLVIFCLGVTAVVSGQTGTPAKPTADYSGTCSAKDCHGSLVAHKVVHPPVAEAICDACHEQADTGKHRFTLTEEGNDLCFECHDEFEGKVVHSPVADGSCTDCHDPHATDTAKLILAPSEAELCTDCHDELLEDLDFLHGPVAASTCTVCHNPHASDIAKLLIAEDGDLCVACHEQKDVKKTSDPYVHEPVLQGCLACHNPHGADNKMNLASSPPDLCIDCHDEIGELVEDATVTHEAVSEGRSCVNCHNPHTSKHEKLLTSSVMPLCLSCHGKPVKSGEDTLLGMDKELSKAQRHGPVADGDCTGCHQPHGSENFRLLMSAYPASFYSPYSEDNYGLCFECHDVEAMEEEETDSATKFRNGERNLHYLHVNKEVKGRTCRACHEPHASNLSTHITESVRFGKWRIPLNHKKTATGGSCRPGCHRLYRYDRNKPVVNIPETKID